MISDELKTLLEARINDELIGTDNEMVQYMSRTEVLLMYIIGLLEENASNEA